jgi:hypothetical protein
LTWCGACGDVSEVAAGGKLIRRATVVGEGVTYPLGRPCFWSLACGLSRRRLSLLRRPALQSRQTSPVTHHRFYVTGFNRYLETQPSTRILPQGLEILDRCHISQTPGLGITLLSRCCNKHTSSPQLSSSFELSLVIKPRCHPRNPHSSKALETLVVRGEGLRLTPAPTLHSSARSDLYEDLRDRHHA